MTISATVGILSLCQDHAIITFLYVLFIPILYTNFSFSLPVLAEGHNSLHKSQQCSTQHLSQIVLIISADQFSKSSSRHHVIPKIKVTNKHKMYKVKAFYTFSTMWRPLTYLNEHSKYTMFLQLTSLRSFRGQQLHCNMILLCCGLRSCHSFILYQKHQYLIDSYKYII